MLGHLLLKEKACVIRQGNDKTATQPGWRFLCNRLLQFDQILGHFALADQETPGGEQTCNAENADHQSERIVVVHNDVPGGGHDQNFQGVARQGIL